MTTADAGDTDDSGNHDGFDDTDRSDDTDDPHAVSLSLEYDDERVARLVANAVAVEVGEIDDDRSTVTVHRVGRTLHVDVSARDLVALRAGVNSWLRLVKTAEDVCALAG